MRLVSFRASGWRNLRALEITPGEQLNVICGDNAQGKTSVLEGIFYVSSLRSFRTARLGELIGWDQIQASAQATVEYGGLRSRLEVVLQKRHRLLQLDGVRVTRSSDYFVGFCAVLFTPDHLSLVRGDASFRRQFLDRVLFELDRGYLSVVRRYAAILKQRNACLKRYVLRRDEGGKVLDTLDIQLGQSAKELVDRRRRIVEELTPLVQDVYKSVAGGGDLDFRYRVRSQDAAADYLAWLLEALAASRADDFHKGYTQQGPHRDDLVIRLHDRLASKIASQGEARSIVLSLKLAEVALLREHHGEAPVLLLDDLGSELDARRRRVLFERIDALGAQTFITTVDSSLVPQNSPAKIYYLQAGKVGSSLE